jgi:outer membrane protein OmpA-like peptidoglycan-associated protein
MGSTNLSLQSDDPPEPPRGGRTSFVALLLLAVVLLAGLGFLGYEMRRRAEAVERQLVSLSAKVDEASTLSRQASERATAAEESARTAAEGRLVAESQTAQARAEADAARQETDAAHKETRGALETAARAQAEADRVQKQAEAEVDRMEEALGQIAETRRTALGLVMNLGSDHLKFDFDKAEIRPQDRELLSRIAGILLTSKDYTVSVNGYTDDVGTEEYNQKLSERRAEAVRDYFVKAGLSPDIFSVTGHGKSRPLVPGTSEEARAKNRRVELGIVNIHIVYGVREKKETNR